VIARAQSTLERLMLTSRSRLAVSLAGWLALLIVAIVVLLPFRSDRHEGAIALVLLVPPLAATASGPLVAGGAAIMTGLAFNFFFTRPYDSPRIESTSSVAAFVIYIVVAVLVSVAAAGVREARLLADRRARDATLLQKMTVELIRNTQLVPTLRSALVQLVDELHLRGGLLDAVVGDAPLTAYAGDADRSTAALERFSPHRDPGTERVPAVTTMRSPGQPAVFPVSAGGSAFGFLIADAGDGTIGLDRERFLESFAGVIALALANARLSEEAIRTRALEETDRLRAVLLQSVSHDLRTPLTTIKATASALRDSTPPPDQMREMLADIEAESDRLARLVTNLLDLSRIESGMLQLDRHPVPVDELVYSALDDARLEIDETRLKVAIADGVPPLDVDETLMRQVLINLLHNALRLDESASPVTITAAAAGDRVELRVIDHGPGIPEAERRRVFEPYHRHRPGTRSAGTGLGLSICRGFTEAHGGSIRAEPTPGGGATIIVSLPVRRGAQA